MASLFDRANTFYKSGLYEVYLELVDDPIQYERITRRKILEAIYDYYDEGDHLLNALTIEEIALLKNITENKKGIWSDRNKPTLESLSNKFIIDYSFYTKDVFIYDEFKSNIDSVLEKVGTKEGKQLLEVQEIAVGLCNAFGALEEDDFFDTICQYVNRMDEKQVRDIVESSHGFGYKIKKITYMIDGVKQPLYIYHDEEIVRTFLAQFKDVLALPKYDFSKEELKNYNIYEINYTNETLQELLKVFKSVNQFVRERDFCQVIKYTIDLLADHNIIKKFVYNLYPHGTGNADLFFYMMDMIDEISATLNTWAARGYPLNQMTEIIGGMQMDAMKRMEQVYQNKTGMLPEEDFEAFLDFMEALSEEEFEDFLNDQNYSKKLN